MTYVNSFYWGMVHIRLFALAPPQCRMFKECRKRLCFLCMQILCTPAHCPPLTNGILPWHCVYHESEMVTSLHGGSTNSGFLLFSTLCTDNVFFYQNFPGAGIISLGHKITCVIYSAFLSSSKCIFTFTLISCAAWLLVCSKILVITAVTLYVK